VPQIADDQEEIFEEAYAEEEDLVEAEPVPGTSSQNNEESETEIYEDTEDSENSTSSTNLSIPSDISNREITLNSEEIHEPIRPHYLRKNPRPSQRYSKDFIRDYSPP
jgi:hypothetical protein